jgi:hypothetical protein
VPRRIKEVLKRGAFHGAVSSTGRPLRRGGLSLTWSARQIASRGLRMVVATKEAGMLVCTVSTRMCWTRLLMGLVIHSTTSVPARQLTISPSAVLCTLAGTRSCHRASLVPEAEARRRHDPPHRLTSRHAVSQFPETPRIGSSRLCICFTLSGYERFVDCGLKVLPKAQLDTAS